jgi:hypothetical protein
MSLSFTTNSSYIADLNTAIKQSENARLLSGDLSRLNAHTDGGASLAIGYGYDLIKNVNNLQADLAQYNN